jgi:ABC-2 type transport system ATP-binding protein
VSTAGGSAVISVRGLRKSYGDVEAVRGIDLEVGAGEVFAFLGPNGAGKTTTVEILEGYRERDAGEISVLGEDPATAGRRWRERIGIVLQSCRQQPELTVRETLELYAGYYPKARGVEETAGLVGLGDNADVRAGKLSGGQQRRLDVALALVGDPELLFLDEPTTGFDPSARRATWKVIANLRDLGKTVFLTTHYMDEAQELADRVAIIAGGELVAEGTPEALADREEAGVEISFRLPPGLDAAELPSVDGSQPRLVDDRVTLRTARAVEALHLLTGWAVERDLDLPALEVRRPSLEDVYLDVTGDGAAAEEAEVPR